MGLARRGSPARRLGYVSPLMGVCQVVRASSVVTMAAAAPAVNVHKGKCAALTRAVKPPRDARSSVRARYAGLMGAAASAASVQRGASAIRRPSRAPKNLIAIRSVTVGHVALMGAVASAACAPLALHVARMVSAKGVSPLAKGRPAAPMGVVAPAGAALRG